MGKLTWEQAADTFRDAREDLEVVVLEPTEPDWHAVLQMAEREQLGLEVVVDGEPKPDRGVGSWLFEPSDEERKLVLRHAGVAFVRKRWRRDQISFALDPTYVCGQGELDAVLGFMSGLFSATGKAIELQDYYGRSKPLARVECDGTGHAVHWRPPALPEAGSGVVSAGGAFAKGALGCVGVFVLLGIGVLLAGGSVRLDLGGLILLLLIGGVLGLIVRLIYNAGRQHPA